MNRTFQSVVILSVLIIFGTMATASGAADWVPINGAASPEKPSTVVLSSNQNETIIKFRTAGFWVENVIEDGVAYQKLSFPAYATTLEVGKPELPVISELVGIPADGNVSVRVLNYKEVTLSGYNVYPFQTPLKETEKRVSFDIDQDFYRLSALYPDQAAGVGEPGIWRDLRVINLKVNPLRYNAATGEIKACSEITVRLDYTGTGGKNVKTAPARPVKANYDRMYAGTVINYSHMNLGVDDGAPVIGESEGAYDYLIIAEDDYVSHMTPLIDWKVSQGLAINIVPVSQVGSDYTTIKDYIANEYAVNGISYVLLVGDDSDIPAYMGYEFFSDYYYTLLEGSDDYADIAIGRFSVANPTEVDNMVSKTVVFESNPPGGDWLIKSLLVANWEEAPYKYQECKEQIRTALELPGQTYDILYPEFTTAYGAAFADGGDEASNADVVNYFNEGFRLVNYRGHGDETRWQYWNLYGEYFRISDVDQIDNGQMTPVVFSIACNNNNIDYGGTTIGEAFTRGDDAAVAYLGATSPSYTYPNHDYDKQLYTVVFDEGINAAADASNEASVRTIALWGDLGITNARMYIWLGDPTLQIISPFDPGAPAPALLSPADGAYFDPPAQVLLDWDDSEGAVSYDVQVDDDADFSSPVGQAEGLTGTEWTTPALPLGNYHWRVRAWNEHRFGGWSEVRTINVGLVVQAPVLYSPSDGSKVKNQDNIALEWYAVDGVVGYDIEIDNNSNFSSPTVVDYSEDCSGGMCVYYISPALRPATFYWRVKASYDGWPWSDPWSFKLTGRVFKDDLSAGIPDQVELRANYPNPFNPSTWISYGLPRASHVKLEIFNLMGQKVETLVDGHKPAGNHTVMFDGSTRASGVYLYRLVTDETVIKKKMLLVK